jgi:hypothetical protein
MRISERSYRDVGTEYRIYLINPKVMDVGIIRAKGVQEIKQIHPNAHWFVVNQNVSIVRWIAPGVR